MFNQSALESEYTELENKVGSDFLGPTGEDRNFGCLKVGIYLYCLPFICMSYYNFQGKKSFVKIVCKVSLK